MLNDNSWKNKTMIQGRKSMSFELNASMMCTNFGNLEKEVKDLEAGEIDSFHSV